MREAKPDPEIRINLHLSHHSLGEGNVFLASESFRGLDARKQAVEWMTSQFESRKLPLEKEPEGTLFEATSGHA